MPGTKFGRLDIRPYESDSLPQLLVAANPLNALSHTDGFVEVVGSAGTVRVIAGPQVSNEKRFLQASPVIESWQLTNWDSNPAGSTNGLGTPGSTVGMTNGGFLITIVARNLGTVCAVGLLARAQCVCVRERVRVCCALTVSNAVATQTVAGAVVFLVVA